jgi:hypothetical protein
MILTTTLPEMVGSFPRPVLAIANENRFLSSLLPPLSVAFVARLDGRNVIGRLANEFLLVLFHGVPPQRAGS